MSHVKCWKIESGIEKGKNMLENTGGIVGFGAILIPTLMGLYYGFRCTFQTDAAIEQWGIGAGSAWMVRFAGVNVGSQNIVYAILLMTSPAGAWAIFAYGTIQSAAMLVMSYLTVNGKWAEVEGVNPTHEGTIVAGILLVCHLYIMFGMQHIIYM